MARKQLILIRHAKCIEAQDFDGIDFDRPLTIDGEHSVFIMARYFRLIGIKPDQILSSPAIRTQETAKVIAEKYNIQDIDWYPELYNGFRKVNEDSNKIYLKTIRNAKASTNTLLVVGHNNDLTNFVVYLTGDTMPSMKKGSAVVLSVPDDITWSEIQPGNLDVVYYITSQFLLLEHLAN